MALCDQDDRWHPDKLESLRGALESGVTLAYSDMNLIDGDGNLISPTYWTDRRTNHTDMTSLLVANTITAAATMFPRRLLDYALPFPAALGHAFHDHWLAMVALATGRIAYVDRPLYDYVQHSANAFGSRGASWKKRDAAKSSDPQSRLRGRARLSWRLLRWRLDYFYNACSARLHAEILMMRCGDALTGRKRRAVKRMTKADRSLPLAARMAVRSLGARRRRSPTMGQERLIARGIVWRRFVDLQGRIRRRGRESHGQASTEPHRRRPRPAHRPQTRPSWFIRSRARSPRSTCGSPRPASRGEHTRADDRPRPLLRCVHRQVQPRAPARGARPAGAHRRRRPHAGFPTPGAISSGGTRASTPSSTRWRSSSPRPASC